MTEDPEVDTVHKKEVTIVAYDDDLEFPSLEDWAFELTGEPTNETEEVVEESWRLVYDLGKGAKEKSLNQFEYDKDEIESVKNQLEAAGVKNVGITHEENRVEEPVVSLSSASTKFGSQIYDELDEELTGGLVKDGSWDRWTGDQDLWHVKFWSTRFSEKRVLAKESERESDDKFETLSEVPCFTIQVKMKGPDSEMLDVWTEEVITETVKVLRKNPAIGKVRFMGCETTTERKGECYNL